MVSRIGNERTIRHLLFESFAFAVDGHLQTMSKYAVARSLFLDKALLFGLRLGRDTPGFLGTIRGELWHLFLQNALTLCGLLLVPQAQRYYVSIADRQN
jgi:hypothetical protein